VKQVDPATAQEAADPQSPKALRTAPLAPPDEGRRPVALHAEVADRSRRRAPGRTGNYRIETLSVQTGKEDEQASSGPSDVRVDLEEQDPMALRQG